MNIVSRFVVFVHVRRLELFLALSILVLIGQLCSPAIMRWWRLPSPGETGFDSFRFPTLEPEFAIQLPQSYYKEQRWPLVVFLHGSGERGKDPNILCGGGPFRQKLPAIVAAPQCRPSCYWEPSAVAGLIRHIVSQYHIDPERVYLVGYSMGGYGTWKTAASHPELFAAIVPISGGGNPDTAKALASIPVWAFHGAQDKVVPVEETRRMIEAIRKADGNPRFAVLRSEGHDICRVVCNRTDLWAWLFQQHRDR